MTSNGKLPNDITVLKEKIRWVVEISTDPKPIHIGTTGPHVVYVTMGTPEGEAEHSFMRIDIFPGPPPTFYEEPTYVTSGDTQVVTEARLAFAIDAIRKAGGKAAGRAGIPAGTTIPEAAEYAGAFFKYLKQAGVHYAIGYRWDPADQLTGLSPNPQLHHYLWLCLAKKALGECHVLAAAFRLGCKVMGLPGSIEVAYAFPNSPRIEVDPTRRFPDVALDDSQVANAPGTSIPAVPESEAVGLQGRLNLHYARGSGSLTQLERLAFIDGNGFYNYFEGVAVYQVGSYTGLYPIGEQILDHYQSSENALVLEQTHPAPNWRAVRTTPPTRHNVEVDTLNSSNFYWMNTNLGSGIRVPTVGAVRTRGLFDLEFVRNRNPVAHGYPISGDPIVFRWES